MRPQRALVAAGTLRQADRRSQVEDRPVPLPDPCRGVTSATSSQSWHPMTRVRRRKAEVAPVDARGDAVDHRRTLPERDRERGVRRVPSDAGKPRSSSGESGTPPRSSTARASSFSVLARRISPSGLMTDAMESTRAWARSRVIGHRANSRSYTLATVLPRERWRRTSATRIRNGSSVSRHGNDRRCSSPHRSNRERNARNPSTGARVRASLLGPAEQGLEQRGWHRVVPTFAIEPEHRREETP